MDLYLLKFMKNAMTLIFSFLDGDVPCRASYGVYISQLGLLEFAIMLRPSMRDINV